MKEGAAGAQFATRFIATAECDASDGYKQRLLNASPGDITLVKSPVGMPGRALRSPLIRRVEDGTQPPPDRCMKCITTCDGKNAPYCISRALIAARNGDWENGLFFCGANAGEINTLSTVQQLSLIHISIRKAGSKSAARDLMRAAGVPVTPGSDGPVSSVEDALAVAETVGYPVLLKASAGGGGRDVYKRQSLNTVLFPAPVRPDRVASSPSRISIFK